MLKKFKDEPSLIGRLHCSLGCRKGCKHESHAHTIGEVAVKGLNSNLVCDEIVATQRPSERLIKEFKITEQFNHLGISAIINLQQPGEHPFCGDGILLESGFSYRPESFMDKGIHYYNFPWHDMGVPNLSLVVQIVQCIRGVTQKGKKVAIHCHAGLGRTGLVIACYLVYAKNMDPQEAILSVRRDRPKALQTRGQVRFVYLFAAHLRRLRRVFVVTLPELVLSKPGVVAMLQRPRLLELTENQAVYVPGSEWRSLLWTPKPIHEVVTMLCYLVESYPLRFAADDALQEFCDEISLFRVDTLAEIFKENINDDDWSRFYDDSAMHPRILGRLFADFFLQLESPVLEQKEMVRAFQDLRASDFSSAKEEESDRSEVFEDALQILFPRQVRHMIRCISRLCCFQHLSIGVISMFAGNIANLFLRQGPSHLQFQTHLSMLLDSSRKMRSGPSESELKERVVSGVVEENKQTRGPEFGGREIRSSASGSFSDLDSIASAAANLDGVAPMLSRHGLQHPDRNVALYATVRRRSQDRKRVSVSEASFPRIPASHSEPFIPVVMQSPEARSFSEHSGKDDSDVRAASCVCTDLSEFLTEYFWERRVSYVRQNVHSTGTPAIGMDVPVFLPEQSPLPDITSSPSSAAAFASQVTGTGVLPFVDSAESFMDGTRLEMESVQYKNMQQESPDVFDVVSPNPPSVPQDKSQAMWIADESVLPAASPAAPGISASSSTTTTTTTTCSPSSLMGAARSPAAVDDSESAVHRSFHLDIQSISQMFSDADVSPQPRTKLQQEDPLEPLSHELLALMRSPSARATAEGEGDAFAQMIMLRNAQVPEDIERKEQFERERPGSASAQIRGHQQEEREKAALRTSSDFKHTDVGICIWDADVGDETEEILQEDPSDSLLDNDSAWSPSSHAADAPGLQDPPASPHPPVISTATASGDALMHQ
eukprot:ANDGO_03874.mRNA.1 Tyrosine-protein phosphatase CDC14